MKRKLVTIQTIDSLKPIKDADFIELATILGWKLVVKKGDFSVGDKCCFFEVDSMLPKDKEEFKFMESRKFRVKTVKIRNQISQGLALPLFTCSVDLSNYNIGDDVTEILGVEKWEPGILEKKARFRSNSVRSFPVFLRKTFETRIQTIPKTLSCFKDKEFYYTEKLDGVSITIFYLKEPMYNFPGNYFGVCSRTLLLGKDKTNAFWQSVIKNDLEKKALEYNKTFCIQGELVGAGIRKNKYKMSETDIFVYSCYDVFDQKYLGWEELENICSVLNLKSVPFLGKFKLNYSVDEIDELVKIAEGKSVLNKNTLREGVVCRHFDKEQFVSFKVMNPEFLLKYE